MILRSSAVHEGGHAAIAHAIGVRGLRAWLEADGGGFCAFGEPPAAGADRPRECERVGAFPDYSVLSATFSLGITLAGCAAERLAGFDPHARWCTGGDADLAENDAIALLEAVGAPVAMVPRVLRCGEQDVDAWLVVPEHWSAVQRIRDALLVELQLDHARIAALAGVLPRPDLACLRATALSLWTRYGAHRRRAVEATA